MDCLLDAVFVARSGGEVADVRMVHPPRGLGSSVGPPPSPGAAKPTYGDDFAFHVDTANFTVQWRDEAVDPVRAEAVAAQLEQAWTALIDDGGWPLPVSADAYRLRVVLDPELGGSGFTTVYATADYPAGYPVSYVNPDYAPTRPDYVLSVAVHEFGHMIQFGVRTLSAESAEAWYWEASAEWMAELGAPELDMYGLSTWWYAVDPTVAFDSTASGHAYGMVLVNAWLAEAVAGDAFQRAWVDQRGEPWEDVLAAQAGMPFEDVVVEMSGAIAASALRESADYYPPTRRAVSAEGDEAIVGRLGTFYYEVPAGLGAFTVDGDAVATFVTEGAWGPVAPEGAYCVAVTTTAAAGTFSYTFETPDAPAAGCGCGAGRVPTRAAALAAFLVVIRRRSARAALR